jgi:deoxyribodipyrimidine photo-lyase
MRKFDRSLVWFRRDLRAFDHAAMHAALTQSETVYCVFIFDRAILDSLPHNDRRVAFIHSSVQDLARQLQQLGGRLIALHAFSEEAIPRLAASLEVDAVFANHDYEPQAVQRDQTVGTALRRDGRVLLTCKDQVIFEKDELLTQGGTPFSVFTPYKKAWLKKLSLDQTDVYLAPYAIADHAARLALPSAEIDQQLPSLTSMGFTSSGTALPLAPGSTAASDLLEDFLPRMQQYHLRRDFPALKGPSYLSVHLRFGTISVRQLVRLAWDALRTAQGSEGAATWLSELIWRDFYFMILHHYPHVVTKAFKPAYDAIQWEAGADAEQAFQAWCEGRTGYPLVDAAMRQLNETGYMHNRLRMVSASFLVKDLGIDWRRGERYFAEKLNDYDLAANNGGWQWAASSGCDAQPYFRIFNPVTQSEKFDADGKFIRRYLPQLSRLDRKTIHAPWLASPSTLVEAGIQLGRDYPQPIVLHDEARRRTLARYAVVKQATTNITADSEE